MTYLMRKITLLGLPPINSDSYVLFFKGPRDHINKFETESYYWLILGFVWLSWV